MRTRSGHVLAPTHTQRYRGPREPPKPASRHSWRGAMFIPNNPHKQKVTINAPVTIQLPFPSSEEQGVGKSPGMRWPWYRFFSSRAPSAYRRYTWPSRFSLPAGRVENRNVILPWQGSYLQGNRHAWPTGGVIEYPKTQSMTRAVLAMRQRRERERSRARRVG